MAGIGLLSLIVCIEIVRAGLGVYLRSHGMRGPGFLGPTFSSAVLVLALAFYWFVFEPAYRGVRSMTGRLEQRHETDVKAIDRFSSIFELHSEAAVALDRNGRYMMANAAAERLVGYSSEELVGRTVLLTPPKYALQVHESMAKALAGEPCRHEMELLCKDGSLCPASIQLIPMREGGEVIGVFCFMNDLTETKRAQRHERMQRDRFRAVSILAGAGGDVEAIIERTLNFATKTLKVDAANVSLLHDDALTVVHGVGDAYQRGIVVPVAQTFARHIIGSREVLAVSDAAEEPWKDDAARKWQSWRSFIATTLFIDGVPAGALSFGKRDPNHELDVADRDFVLVVASLIASALERKRREQHLNEMAFVDPLTTLPNRSYLNEQLDLAIAGSRRDGLPFAVQYVDLDGFKDVNDRLGHVGGDQVLSVIGARLKMAARESDVVARLGGDEFIVLQTRMDGDDAITRLASRLVNAVTEPIIVSEEVVRLGASIGVARFPVDAQTAEDLIRCADEAMYRAKRSGRNRLEIYA